MKFLARVVGTWILGLAAILIIIDGTKTLAAKTLVTTSLADTWAALNAASWKSVNEWLIGVLAPIPGLDVAAFVSGWPGWLIAGVFGFGFLFIGRRRTHKSYIQTH